MSFQNSIFVHDDKAGSDLGRILYQMLKQENKRVGRYLPPTRLSLQQEERPRQ